MPARKPKKLPKILSRTEVYKLINSINTKTKTGLRNYVAIVLMWRCGLRVSEVCNLEYDDVDMERKILYIQESKNKTDRYVKFDKYVYKWIQEWIKVRPESNFFLCAVSKGSIGKQLNQRQLREVVYRLSKKTGVYILDGHKRKLVHPHIFRHTYATELLEENFNLREIQKLLGHSNIQTTTIYAEIRDKELEKKVWERDVS